jgi:hypothetical protein
VITLAEDDHAKNGAPVRKMRSWWPKTIMQKALVPRDVAWSIHPQAWPMAPKQY